MTLLVAAVFGLIVATAFTTWTIATPRRGEITSLAHERDYYQDIACKLGTRIAVMAEDHDATKRELASTTQALTTELRKAGRPHPAQQALVDAKRQSVTMDISTLGLCTCTPEWAFKRALTAFSSEYPDPVEPLTPKLGDTVIIERKTDRSLYEYRGSPKPGTWTLAPKANP